MHVLSQLRRVLSLAEFRSLVPWGRAELRAGLVLWLLSEGCRVAPSRFLPAVIQAGAPVIRLACAPVPPEAQAKPQRRARYSRMQPNSRALCRMAPIPPNPTRTVECQTMERQELLPVLRPLAFPPCQRLPLVVGN